MYTYIYIIYLYIYISIYIERDMNNRFQACKTFVLLLLRVAPEDPRLAVRQMPDVRVL